MEDHFMSRVPPPDRDRVAQDADTADLTPAQRTELERRLADSIARPEAVTPWEEIKACAIARAKQ